MLSVESGENGVNEHIYKAALSVQGRVCSACPGAGRLGQARGLKQMYSAGADATILKSCHDANITML